MRLIGNLWTTTLLICLSLAFGNSAFSSDYHEGKHDKAKYSRNSGSIVIANRGSGSISVINTATDTVSQTVALPAASNPSQPMYVTHSPRANYVFVGDRGNNRVVVFDDEDYSVVGTIPTGNGVFHMWSDPLDSQLWVNNDIDNTITVIDPLTLEVLHTVAAPADLVALGGKPHDVILDPVGKSAFVTFIGVNGDDDFVVKYDTDSFQETARAAVGKDPHVSLTRRNKLLYVPTQNNNAVYILKRRDLSVVKILDIPGAHGAGMARNGKTFYTTNISGGGADGLFAIDTKFNKVIGASNTPFPTPHNIALTAHMDKLYVTHSGVAADQVSVYSINKKTRLPKLLTTVTVELNPFGLAFVR